MGDTSIDHLVIEKVENIVMIEDNFDCMDVGTWGLVLELSKRFNKNFESFQDVTKGRETFLMTENDEKFTR
ncbi:putative mannose-1-phosphate guanylyltransferase [Wolbachia endosymbiont of Trichogramma pretiosum]|nr:putative mannose-1-phosphate guanylyltransferase [Wolbachia endosymbiont of Trichogramma pretiosum]